ncbi:hypothetical protein C0J52_18890 [Blattella germanica]|nr:hypothetical protein C0J52_18890 [Blattella germanica]
MSTPCESCKIAFNRILVEKLNGKLKIPLENATKRAAAATGKSEATVCKIRKEAKVASSSGEKLKSPGKNRSTSAKKIVIDDFDINIIIMKLELDIKQFNCMNDFSLFTLFPTNACAIIFWLDNQVQI